MKIVSFFNGQRSLLSLRLLFNPYYQTCIIHEVIVNDRACKVEERDVSHGGSQTTDLDVVREHCAR